MTYTFVTLVSLLTINVLVPVFCRLSQCNLAISNRVIKSRQWPSFGKIDKRDLVEYFVTYINDDNERVTFDRTNTTNTPRFQPMRWFNINEKIGDILPMIYDYFFSITRYFMNIQTIHIDLNVTPKDCIYSIDYEEVEILTRKFFIGHVSIVDSHICSANIVDKNGIGVVSYNCCRVVESSNETVCSDINEDFDWLTGVNIVAIVASILIMGVIFMLILLSPTGTEEFYFYPTNMVIDYTAGESTNNDGSRNASGESTNNDGSRNASGESTNKAGSMNAASNETKIRIRVFETCNRKETFQRKTGTSNKNEVIIDKLKILLTKKQCVDNNYSAITFFRCITEFLTGLDSSYCKPSKNLNKCFFSCDCCSDKPMCLPLVRLYLGKVVFLVFSIIFFVPTCYLLYKTKNNNMLCSELEVKGLSCPFSVGTASFCFYVLSFFYCAVIALYFFPCNNFITMLIPELPWSEYDKSDTFRYPRGCEIVKIIVSLLSMAVVFTTWGFFLYFLITLLLRILIMSSSTRNILDDFSFVIFPLFLVVYDYITNVTKEFKVISENIFDLVRNDDELKCSSINSKKKLNEAILLSGEDQTIEGSLTYVGKELRLNINCPFIFQRRDGRMYTSKRLVTQIYNDSSEFLPFELSAYLKAFLVSLVPCALYAIVFMVFVTYTSIISYSTHVAGYTATALTGLKWLHSKVGSLIQEILISNKSVKQSVKERLKQERLNFHESWKVSAIHFKGDAAPIEIPQQVD